MKNIIFVIICMFFVTSAYGNNYYESWLQKYDAVLKKHVKQGEKTGIYTTLVDYEAIEKDEDYKSLFYIGRTDGKRGRGYWNSFSEEKRLAFYINFHNFLAINYIIKNKVYNSINDIKKATASISGALNRRKMSVVSAFNTVKVLSNSNPMVYFALNRGIVGDPPLRGEAYTGENLEKQLNDQLKQYFISGAGKKLKNKKKQIVLSSVFEYSEFDKRPKEWLIKRGRLVAFAHDYKVVYEENNIFYVNSWK